MIINFCFFVVSIKAVSNLKEMGFQEDEIVMALKATVNNQEAAVSYSCHYRFQLMPKSSQRVEKNGMVLSGCVKYLKGMLLLTDILTT